MKYIALLLVASFIAAAMAGEAKEKVVEMFNKCKETHPVSEEEVEQFKKKEPVPSSSEAKCLMACMLKEGKVLKDGVYSKDNALMLADVLHKEDPEQASKAKEVIEHCTKEVGTEVGADECEFAYKMAVCGSEHAKKLGVKTPDF
ncbi:general odorant-binding protein 19d-like [Cimex lectularius]|uniref:Odorant binding protein n=1 Tax=Cimex lectularius TaxID=79782 RepID=A0A8I6TCN6_CIMLE|nr:general odorant-binding protein 19d-like [Cimex lectularius]